jgi:S1-C subfamily serine protease
MAWPTVTPPAPRRRSSCGATALLLVLLPLAALTGYFVYRQGAGLRQPGGAPVLPRPIEARGDLAADEQATIAIFEKSAPSVVYVTNLAVRRDLLGLNVMEVPQGTGSGFLWDDLGHVVTNFHVIQAAQAAEVTLADHSTWKARLVGYEADKDLAVLRIDAPKDRLKPLALGTSRDLKVGQKVFAIGNPFGLDHTLTTGVISALGREIQALTGRAIRDVIQTDAVINPGNSGGPLLDSAGRLIGVNTAIYSPGGSGGGTFIGIGFAVPVDTVSRIIPQIVAHGRVVRPGLGVVVAEDRVTRELGVPGVLVLDVTPGSAAEKAGLRPTRRDENGRVRLGDFIVAVDGEEVETRDDLLHRLEQKAVGASIMLQVRRGDEVVELPVSVQALQAE